MTRRPTSPRAIRTALAHHRAAVESASSPLARLVAASAFVWAMARRAAPARRDEVAARLAAVLVGEAEALAAGLAAHTPAQLTRTGLEL